MTKDEQKVILVDENDKEMGLEEVEAAHLGVGQLHRAVSLVLHDGKGNVLIQRRSREKLLWPGGWSNATCTHRNYPGTVVDWAVRRVKEEMGIVVAREKLRELYAFRYQARYNEQYSEHEYDHVVIGKYSGEVVANPAEVSEWRWVHVDDLKEEIYRSSDKFTPWFKLIIDNRKMEKALGHV